MLYVAILQLQIYICSQIVFRLVGPQYWWCVLGWRAGEYHVCPESRGRQSCAGSVSSVMKPPLQWGTLTDLQIVTTTSHLTQLDITMDCIFHFPSFGETDN